MSLRLGLAALARLPHLARPVPADLRINGPEVHWPQHETVAENLYFCSPPFCKYVEPPQHVKLGAIIAAQTNLCQTKTGIIRIKDLIYIFHQLRRKIGQIIRGGWAYNFFVCLSLLQMSVALPELNIIGINKKSSQKLSRKLKSCLALVSLFGAPQRFNF